MDTMNPLYLGPAAIFGLLTGVALTTSRRKVLSMLPPEKPSPLQGVTGLAWQRFVTVMVMAPKRYISPRNRLGYFGMDARKLSDVGFMTGAHKATVSGETGVWSGEWHAPLTQEKFLDSAGAQYEAFARSARRAAPQIAHLVASDVDGKPASLSGLLAAAHLSGTAGLDSWARDPAVRARFQATTKNFQKANGIF